MTAQQSAPNDLARLERAVEIALAAPSIHNTQPWRWRVRPDRIELHADLTRRLTGTDPDGRDFILSCGAALHHLRVALAGLGMAAEVERLPDPEDRAHLATVRVVPGHPDPADLSLFGQINRRHTDRRHYASKQVEPPAIALLAKHAEPFGAILIPIVDRRTLRRLHDVMSRAGAEQPREPGYLVELITWAHRYSGTGDGVPPSVVTSLPEGPSEEEAHFHRFTTGSLPEVPGAAQDGGMLVVLATPADGLASRLSAGEAMSAVLLAATREGLASALLSQAVEVPSARRKLREEVLGIAEHPQIVVRLGYPAPGAPPVPPTPRRSLGTMLI